MSQTAHFFPVALLLEAETGIARTAVRFTFPHWLRQPLDAVADAVAASVAAVGSTG